MVSLWLIQVSCYKYSYNATVYGFMAPEIQRFINSRVRHYAALSVKGRDFFFQKDVTFLRSHVLLDVKIFGQIRYAFLS